MTCEICVSACKTCRSWGQSSTHMVMHSMALSGASWRCKLDHRLDADPVDVMTANGAERMF